MEMKNVTDFDIIESIRLGNQADFSILVDRYKNKAFSLLVRMLKNNMEAEEVLQDCFMKVFNGLPNFKMESKFSTWFYRIVYNTAVTRISRKKRKIEREMESTDDNLELHGEEFNSAEQQDLSIFISSLVEQLPVKYSTIINLYYLENMNCEEIGNILDLSNSNVKVLLYRSRNALKELIEKKDYRKEIL